MKIAILQSCYIPWKGYFDIIGSVDTFVIYDDVQYSKNHWHNRNIIRNKNGNAWLTIPVSHGKGLKKQIDEVNIASPFAEGHWQAIRQAYARAPFFSQYESKLTGLYESAAKLTRLSDINFLFLRELSRELGFTTRFCWSSELQAKGKKTERLVDICQELRATEYLSGPSAKAYLDEGRFQEAGITVHWMDYTGYPPYPQLHGPFEHAVSIIDVLLNVGPEARRFMKAPLREATLNG